MAQQGKAPVVSPDHLAWVLCLEPIWWKREPSPQRAFQKLKRKVLNIRKKDLIMFLETPLLVFVMCLQFTQYILFAKPLSYLLILITIFIRWVALSLFYRWENIGLKRVINMPEALPICDAFGISEMKHYPQQQWEALSHYQPLCSDQTPMWCLLELLLRLLCVTLWTSASIQLVEEAETTMHDHILVYLVIDVSSSIL